MKILIQIDTEKAAFEDNGPDELDTVLKDAKNFAALRWACGGERYLFDSNGNRCGKITIS